MHQFCKVPLYLASPENALVLCVDEKPNIQALEPGKGYESVYKRHGTLNLFAALEVATGRIHGKTTAPGEKTKKGFLAFLEEVLSGLPASPTVEYHVIMDNHSIHKRHEAWLSRHPNVFFHYTPTSASWLNMVEIWFGILTLKSLRGASFQDTGQLWGTSRPLWKPITNRPIPLCGGRGKSEGHNSQILSRTFATRH